MKSVEIYRVPVVAAAAAVLLAGCASDPVVEAAPRDGAPAATASPARAATEVPEGWRAVSSGGLEVHVPTEWPRAVSPCEEDAHGRPYVIAPWYGAIAGVGCGKEPRYPYVRLNSSAAPAPEDPVAVDGTSIEPTQDEDGFWGAAMFSPRYGTHLVVAVRARDLAAQVLATVQEIAEDSAGCVTEAPPADRVRTEFTGPQDRMLPAQDPASVSLCVYDSAARCLRPLRPWQVPPAGGHDHLVPAGSEPGLAQLRGQRDGREGRSRRADAVPLRRPRRRRDPDVLRELPRPPPGQWKPPGRGHQRAHPLHPQGSGHRLQLQRRAAALPGPQPRPVPINDLEGKTPRCVDDRSYRD